MPRSLAQWVDYIQTLHPRTIDLSLERVATVWGRFKPAKMPPVIAVAGTNGKGSSVSMLESVYRHAGYQTGVFTSPHLVRFNERICLNNQAIEDQLLVQAFEEIEQLRQDTRLTFFEFNTLLALNIFCRRHLDIILLEVGMGGRLDAVNVVENDMALITAISIDHSAWLGNDREKIGVEKAGIIKASGLAVLADPQLPKSVRRTAEKRLAKTVEVGRDYEIANAQAKAVVFSSSHPRLVQYDNFKISTAIPHQQENTAGVIAVVAMLNFVLPVSRKQLAKGLKNQNLSARLQLIDREPTLLLDVSHNEESVSAMIAFIDGLQINGRIHAIFGALADKRYNTAFTELKKRVDAWYLTTLDGERGQSAQALADKLFSAKEKMTINYQLFKTPKSAFDLAKRMADKHDIIVIFGSFHVVGAILPIIEF